MIMGGRGLGLYFSLPPGGGALHYKHYRLPPSLTEKTDEGGIKRADAQIKEDSGKVAVETTASSCSVTGSHAYKSQTELWEPRRRKTGRS